jgi:hypothetical protein
LERRLLFSTRPLVERNEQRLQNKSSGHLGNSADPAEQGSKQETRARDQWDIFEQHGDISGDGVQKNRPVQIVLSFSEEIWQIECQRCEVMGSVKSDNAFDHKAKLELSRNRYGSDDRRNGR